MKRFRLASAAVAVFLLAAALPGAVQAGDAEDLARLETAKISLAEAVGIAETAAEGRAIEAELDADFGKTVYDVVVVKEGRFYDLRIDAGSGAVLAMAEDKD